VELVCSGEEEVPDVGCIDGMLDSRDEEDLAATQAASQQRRAAAEAKAGRGCATISRDSCREWVQRLAVEIWWLGEELGLWVVVLGQRKVGIGHRGGRVSGVGQKSGIGIGDWSLGLGVVG
jgi:hypothetical protein